MLTTITYVFIAILAFDFVVERVLAYLNAKYTKLELPEALKNLYDAEKYAQQQAYSVANQRFGMISSSFSFVVILLMLFFGGFAWINDIVTSVTEQYIFVSLLFFGILLFANDLLSTPFELYDHFVIEQKFGFNKMTAGIFIGDKVKGWLLTAILGGGILALINWIYSLTPDYFWLLAWLVMAVFSIFINMFYSQLIVPLFNKQTPLPDGELRTEIEKFAEKAGFQLNNIFVMDGSKRSTKANAYFSGLGAKKRVVLFDTLIEELTTEEIVAVLAHEIGHYKKKHTLWSLVLSLLNSLVMLSLLGLFLSSDSLAQALGVSQAAFHINLLAFGLLYSPVSFFLSVLLNIFSRRNEYQADAFAAQYGYANALIEALKKISVKALSNLQPHPLYVFFHYSHPTLLQRMEALNKLEN
jgi:STE24 endopeptidase